MGKIGVLSNPFIRNDSDATSIIISELSPFTNYTVSICALTSTGCGIISNSTAQTDEDGTLIIFILHIHAFIISKMFIQLLAQLLTWIFHQILGPTTVLLLVCHGMSHQEEMVLSTIGLATQLIRLLLIHLVEVSVIVAVLLTWRVRSQVSL